jgi:hypothetical protein
MVTSDGLRFAPIGNGHSDAEWASFTPGPLALWTTNLKPPVAAMKQPWVVLCLSCLVGLFHGESEVHLPDR